MKSLLIWQARKYPVGKIPYINQQFEIVTFPPKVVSTYVHTCELIQYYKPDSPSSKIVSYSA